MSANSSYSGARSGASSPRGSSSNSATPPPDASGPSPLTVGTRFVKQYYHVLTTDTPEHIVKFYQPSSVLSTGTASQPSVATVSSEAAERFSNTTTGSSSCSLRFEFEHGAIDAQATGASGILLTVTGQVICSTHAAEEDEHYEEDDESSTRCQAFVQTFVLNSNTNNQGKRSYYVQNDILRFLNENLTAKTSSSSSNNNHVTTGNHVATATEEHGSVVEDATVIASNQATTSVEEGDTASGGGVEESKETILDDEEKPALPTEEEVPVVVVVEDVVQTVVTAEKQAETANQSAWNEGMEDNSAESNDRDKSAASSSSWASLVARPGPATPSRVPVVASPARKTKPADQASSAAKPSSGGKAAAQPNTGAKSPVPAKAVPAAASTHIPLNKRDADFTLVIKNVSGQAKEPEVMAMFEPFAKETDATIVSITVAAQKGIAFIDFSSAAPVLAAVEQHKLESFQLHGRVLDVYQKSLERSSRRGAGNRYFGGQGGGRQHRGGRGERGGRSGRGGR